jgi:hypothetical protein
MSLSRYLSKLGGLLNSSGQVPASTGVAGLAAVATSGSAADLGTGRLPSARVPAGCVLQVVQTVKLSAFDTSSTTAVDITGLTATITPRDVNSKILVEVRLQIGGTSATYHSYYRLNRNGAALSTAYGDGAVAPNRVFLHKNMGDTRDMDCAAMDFLDSPATASAVTYNVQMWVQGNSFSINRSRMGDSWDASGISTITLTEIAG